jgi:hypothetical protein
MTRALAAIAALCAAGAFGGCGFGGDESSAGPGAPLTPPESSWVPGQRALGAYPQFAAIFARAAQIAVERRESRELALERIERQKIAARNRADAEARRRYLEAKRRAERAYKRALAEAAEKRRAQEARLRRIRERIARLNAARERKLRVNPGEECRLAEVRRRYDCRRGRLPDPAGDRKNRRE